MRLYVVDQIAEEHIQSILARLRQKEMESSLENMFWLQIPESLLTDAQREHLAECGPYALSLEVGRDDLKLELLARAQNRLHCGCIAYANNPQRDFALDWLDGFLHELDIPV